MTLALEHYALVIEAYGSAEQRKHLKRLRHNAVEARWELIEQLTKDAHFGVENPNVSQLQRGRSQRNKARADDEGGEEGEEGAGDGEEDAEDDEEEEDAEDDEEEEDEPEPPRRGGRRAAAQREDRTPAARRKHPAADESPASGESPETEEGPRKRQSVVCQLGTAEKPGMCGRVGCSANRVQSGCGTCGMRFCLWKCMNAHLRGACELKCLRSEVSWKDE
eukprot:CAMPEP_0181218512 /NCGR_PEP_ID=MMETSP1096-20121128/27736_1 /TAXON_ID=156174 ORGANISM="Chrysochromulina ericina, Strain CCMP281" /NCGR_SAMPLE_ID=MMETSP1096 /ASSEMBLY_ACC=CAM_ASM_000453 /LENGTH=220 /DNA_ID=CAMNT_0023310739 /DNA_START=264 /DNA_END=926 /DNA_ORIENTATION=-